MYLEKFISVIGVSMDAPEAEAVFRPFPLRPPETNGFSGDSAFLYFSCREGGLQVVCDRRRIIRSLFVYGSRQDGFSSFEGELWQGGTVRNSQNEVRRTFGSPAASGRDFQDFLSGAETEWDRYKIGPVFLFFQYHSSNDGIDLIAITESAPPSCAAPPPHAMVIPL